MRAEADQAAHPPADEENGGAARIRRWTSQHRTASLVLGVGLLVAAMMPTVVLLLYPDLTDPIGEWSYAGVFAVNLISTGTLFIPVPGVTAAANVLIATEGSDARFPWLMGIAGGAGMAIGEFTAYYAGIAGSHVSRARIVELPARIETVIARVSSIVRRLMDRWGMITLFVLAAIPDPVFEVAAVSAGSVRMPVRRFFAAVLAGCIVRGLTLAYLGTKLPFLTG
jgi:membrane protein DedA with SNARE-associated domain